MTDTKTMWRQRVASWRASGETADEFSRPRGYASTTLRWYASKLRHEAEAAPVPSIPAVRMVQVIRTTGATELVDGRRGGGIVVDLLDVRARITVEAGVARDTLMLVLGALGVGGAR